MKTVFVSHPFAGSPIRNQYLVRSIARTLVFQGHLPVAPQLYVPCFVDERTERDLALRLCVGLVAICDEVQVYGEPTAGMRLEIAEAQRLGIPVVRRDSK